MVDKTMSRRLRGLLLFSEESVVREPQGTPRRSLILHRKKARDPQNLKLSNTLQECGEWDLNPHDCNSH